MKLFLDTEFNGFGGKLMSMALVPEYDAIDNFYCELEMSDQLDPWVKENVVPRMILVPSTRSQFQDKLSSYLLLFDETYGELTIVADWPDDIKYFCEALIMGPGERINIPTRINFELDLNIEYESAVAHNALHDAIAIREYYRKIL